MADMQSPSLDPVARAPLATWDNSTRGLDAASALEFVKALRNASDLTGSCHAVATYQASQAIYDVFDKVIVLYGGREIYFGPCSQAERYFTTMGWVNPPRQTTGDFLTSVTNPQERVAREGMEDALPRTPEEFESYWKRSPEYAALQKEMKKYEIEYPLGGRGEEEVAAGKLREQAKHVRPKSPYLISVPMQLKLCIKRAYQRYVSQLPDIRPDVRIVTSHFGRTEELMTICFSRIWNDKASTLTLIVGRIVMSLIVASIFYG